jgi:ceramide synthetase
VKFLDLSLAYDKLVYYVFNTMLLMLLVFHIYWWILIYSMIMRQLRNRGRVGEDIRSGKLSTLLILQLNLEHEWTIPD